MEILVLVRKSNNSINYKYGIIIPSKGLVYFNTTLKATVRNFYECNSSYSPSEIKEKITFYKSNYHISTVTIDNIKNLITVIYKDYPEILL